MIEPAVVIREMKDGVRVNPSVDEVAIFVTGYEDFGLKIPI